MKMGVHTCSCLGLRGGRGGSKGFIMLPLAMGEKARKVCAGWSQGFEYHAQVFRL